MLNSLIHSFFVSENESVKTYFKGHLDVDMDAFVKLGKKIYEDEMTKLDKRKNERNKDVALF